MWWRKKTGVIVAALACLTVIDAEDVIIRPTLPAAVDAESPVFMPDGIVADATGTLQWGGPMVMANCMTFWAEGLHHRHPGIKQHIEPGRDLEIWPPTIGQLIAGYGAPNLALVADRPMHEHELQELRTKMPGLRVLEVPIAFHALVIVVHPDNPLPAMTLDQVDAIFSSERRRGRPHPITAWAELGATGTGSVHPCGRSLLTGSARYFSRLVMNGSRFSSSVREFSGWLPLLREVAEQRGAIGYAMAAMLDPAVAGPLAKTTDGLPLVRVVPLLIAEDTPSVVPTRTTVLDGSYPLCAPLTLRFPIPANGALSPAQRLALRWAISREGQGIIAEEGLIPLPASWCVALRPLTD